MATFGTIGSAVPNVLFNPMAIDQAVMAQRKNALLMEKEQQELNYARQNGGLTPYQKATIQQKADELASEQQMGQGILSSLGLGGAAPAPAVAPGAAPAPAAAPADGAPVAAAPGDLAARVLYGEAGNQGPDGLLAAAHVIANRARLTGKSPEDVVTAPGQFEAYGNEATRARLMALKPEQYAAAQQALQAATSGQAPDPTGGATHYLNPQLQAQMGRQQPAWATGEGTRIGQHVFYSRPGDFQQTAQTPTAARTGGTDVAGPGVPAAPNPNELTREQAAIVAPILAKEPLRGAVMVAQFRQQNAAANQQTIANARAEAAQRRAEAADARRLTLDEQKAARDEAAGRAKEEETGFSRANTLRDEFTNLTKDYRVVQRAYAGLKESGTNPTPAGDMALMYQFNNLLDPNSVVKESEFANVARTGSLGTQIQAGVERILSGQRLTDEQRKDIIGQAERLVKAHRRTYDQARGQYRGLAERYKLDPDAVTPDFTLPEEAPPQQDGAPQRGPGYEDPRGLGLDGMPTVRTPEEAHALPPGTHYLTPDGRTFKR